MKKLLLAFALALLAVPASALTADEMRASAREGNLIRSLTRDLAEIGITAPQGASSDALQKMLDQNKLIVGGPNPGPFHRTRTKPTVRCERIVTSSSYWSYTRAIYIVMPTGAYQVLPENEGIVQEGDNVRFLGVTNGNVARGDFVVPNASLELITNIYFDCLAG